MYCYKNIHNTDAAHYPRDQTPYVIALAPEQLLYSSVDYHREQQKKVIRVSLTPGYTCQSHSEEIPDKYPRASCTYRKLPSFKEKRTVGSPVAHKCDRKEFLKIHALKACSDDRAENCRIDDP